MFSSAGNYYTPRKCRAYGSYSQVRGEKNNPQKGLGQEAKRLKRHLLQQGPEKPGVLCDGSARRKETVTECSIDLMEKF